MAVKFLLNRPPKDEKTPAISISIYPIKAFLSFKSSLLLIYINRDGNFKQEDITILWEIIYSRKIRLSLIKRLRGMKIL